MRVLIENLESRQLMSSTIPNELFDDVMSTMVVSAKPQAGTTAPITRGASPTPSLIGIYRGWVQISSEVLSRKVSFVAHITRQTNTSIGGSIKVMGKTYRGNVPVTFNGRNFSANYDNADVSGTLSVTIAVDGSSFKGTFSGSAYGFDGSGRFSATRQA